MKKVTFILSFETNGTRKQIENVFDYCFVQLESFADDFGKGIRKCKGTIKVSDKEIIIHD